jgi:hypothetical protein
VLLLLVAPVLIRSWVWHLRLRLLWLLGEILMSAIILYLTCSIFVFDKISNDVDIFTFLMLKKMLDIYVLINDNNNGS